MLKLTKKVEYALMSVVYISEQGDEKLSSAKEIALANSIPSEILAKTLQRLASLNIIESVKGPKGGYKIIENINKINIIDFIEMLEGPVGLTDCSTFTPCNQECNCIIKDPMIIINNEVINTLKKITLGHFTKLSEDR